VPLALVFGKVWGVLWTADSWGGDEGGTRILWWRFRWVRNELEKADKSIFSVD
jgi:hypothetical protein